MKVASNLFFTLPLAVHGLAVDIPKPDQARINSNMGPRMTKLQDINYFCESFEPIRRVNPGIHLNLMKRFGITSICERAKTNKQQKQLKQQRGREL
ncbi:hypothetical protein DSO57_1033938 [Entomophthora muscae]|uniref:Uncharacterized protein n=1 Tax=Entomophthora muscae TaxID=34485 RepID=A0ACC2SCW5_9FUNG|nr:hypothetical protein DSO57_1033938 [Entomophthora muscae]